MEYKAYFWIFSNTGVPYVSLVKLNKTRIIPVGLSGPLSLFMFNLCEKCAWFCQCHQVRSESTTLFLQVRLLLLFLAVTVEATPGAIQPANFSLFYLATLSLYNRFTLTDDLSVDKKLSEHCLQNSKVALALCIQS